MDKGIVYYTDNRIKDPLFSIVQKYLEKSGLPIASCSLKPIEFGNNIVVESERSYPTMVRQIMIALLTSESDIVFFCEHDVLYHPSHFEFTPPRKDLYYYNTNNWRWLFPQDRLITYDNLISLSGMCCNRELAVRHFQHRLDKIYHLGLENFQTREPQAARRMGYEPGTKPKRKGGVSNEGYDVWRSEYPNIDIRHSLTFSPPKTRLEDFKHQPSNFITSKIADISGWDLKGIFNL